MAPNVHWEKSLIGVASGEVETHNWSGYWFRPSAAEPVGVPLQAGHSGDRPTHRIRRDRTADRLAPNLRAGNALVIIFWGVPCLVLLATLLVVRTSQRLAIFPGTPRFWTSGQVSRAVRATPKGSLPAETVAGTPALVPNGSRRSDSPTLGDDIIGSLFSAGLSLDRLADGLSDPQDKTTLDAAMQHLDDAVRGVQIVLYAIDEPTRSDG